MSLLRLLSKALASFRLQTLAGMNPLTHVVEGLRAVFRGEVGSGESLLGAGVALALVMTGIAYGTRVFRRESA